MRLLYQTVMLFFIITLLCGIIYPSFITGIAQVVFNDKSNGSLVKDGEQILGSRLISQDFKDIKYFWPRPSSSDFQAFPSGATNLGPTSSTLATKIQNRRATLASAFGVQEKNIPSDLLSASGSGLDPHISVEAAKVQAKRIAKARGVEESKIYQLIDDHIEGDKLTLFSARRVNVLMLNMSLNGWSSP